MSLYADTTRKYLQDLLSIWRASRGPAHAACLREIQEDVAIISPKVYESGIITSLDPRLVDLYGGSITPDEALPVPAERALVC